MCRAARVRISRRNLLGSIVQSGISLFREVVAKFVQTHRALCLCLVFDQRDIIGVESGIDMSQDEVSELRVLPPQRVESGQTAPVVCQNAYDGLAVSFSNRTIVAVSM
jgi:hypothetical protein